MMLTRRAPTALTRARVLPISRRPFGTIQSTEDAETALPTATAEPEVPGYNHPLQSVAVLGGGISGLTAAWYLTKFAPGVPVTLYERSSRLGGWFETKHVPYGSEGKTVAFEQGPRTLRPWTLSALPVFDMIRQLGIIDQVQIVPRDAPAAKNRYIYYGGKLNPLPNSITSAFTSLGAPAFKGLASGALLELFRKRRDVSIPDETVGSFMTRRLNAHIAQNLVSAMVHGIYAGDVDQLSARSIFPKQWRHEMLYGSITRGMISGSKIQLLEDIELRDELYWRNHKTLLQIEKASVYSFKGGIETLSRALERELVANRNVTIKRDTPVTALAFDASDPDNFEPFTLNSTDRHSHVISTLPAHHLAPLLPTIPDLSHIPAATVLVVSLYLPTAVPPVRGFGYLLPKSLPASENPHRALGVIFDHESLPDPDAPGTKLTVMFGGHYYGATPPTEPPADAVQMARDVVREHLGIVDEPAAWNVALQRECIPQYTLGHEERLERIASALEDGFDGRLAVAGSSYRGVGVNDCVRFAREAAKGVGERGGATGLEGVVPTVVEAVTVPGVWKKAPGGEA